jgi:Arc/MetJ-type ribon-helix-helix transcriptional regulator
MQSVKIAVTIDQELVAQLDQLVNEKRFPSRSRAVQEAVREQLKKLRRGRYARECAKLDSKFEKALADEGLIEDSKQWPEY